MLETERYGDAKGLLGFLLQCGGEAERHHTEWQALLGWLEAAFPDAPASGAPGEPPGDEPEEDAEDELRQRVLGRSGQDAEYVPRLLATLFNVEDPEQQLVALGQLAHVNHPDVEDALRRWLGERERHPLVQFRVLQQLRQQGATGSVGMWRDGELLQLEIEATPLQFEDYPQSVQDVLDRVRQTAEVSDPTLAYFAEEMWKECVQTAYGTPVFRRMMEEDDGAADVWAAALHQFLYEKLHGQSIDEWVREQYGITGELRFRYEQSLRWLRQYAGEGRP
nr:HEAT repeat domain-containing protein [Cohnella sp. REN36]